MPRLKAVGAINCENWCSTTLLTRKIVLYPNLPSLILTTSLARKKKEKLELLILVAIWSGRVPFNKHSILITLPLIRN
ncbi:hypothetical protein SADUNF_Sadunf08G0128300 [Salix dunnii]|uniref:Uncharacterized protein n=1 Tax=Salix dunnii TaxID=1413687 RepID=A0A835JXL0_9ROSI|nr:hypothetical protein SADUNF_Sadunf08G0128300 [Salix dunnii]